MVSVLLLTIDRYDIAPLCIGQTLANAGYPYELLCVDNGSTDSRTIEYIQSLSPAYHRLNKENGGVARMLNQMLLRSKGDYVCRLDNDMAMPPGWLKTLVAKNNAIPQSGISGVHFCPLSLPLPTRVGGVDVYLEEHPLGIQFFNRSFLDKVGYFDEEFHPYGYEDVVLQSRSTAAGYLNYFATTGAEHLGPNTEDSYQTKMSCVNALRTAFVKRVTDAQSGLYYTPPPQLIP